MSQIEATRKKIFEESRFDPLKQRYGLFSYPGTLAVGDDSHNRPRANLREGDGSVKIGPKNFYTSTTKRDFSAPQFTAIGDKYQEAPRPQLREKERVDQMNKVHSAYWKAGACKEPGLFSGFKYVSEQRDTQTNKGIPKNFFTANPQQGKAGSTPGLTFGKYPEHMSDPYERKQEILKGQRQMQRSKILNQPFRTTVYGAKNFTNYKDLYGEQTPGENLQERPKTTASGLHQKPFLPTNPPQFSIGKYPEHAADPLREAVKSQKTQKDPWRPAQHAKTLHQPTVQGHPTNFRRKHYQY